VYVRISRGPVALHLSSYPGDGTPGSAVVVQVDDVSALQRDLATKNYPFMSPRIEPRGIAKNCSYSTRRQTKSGSSRLANPRSSGKQRPPRRRGESRLPPRAYVRAGWQCLRSR
jgi:hypothetical protein